MSEHARWKRVQDRSNSDDLSSTGRRQLIDYTEGYILAMEDVLKDIQPAWYDEGRDDDWFNALHSISNRVEESLLSAKQTLEVLESKEEE